MDIEIKGKHRYDLQVGSTDEFGRKVSKIYACEPGNYIIYSTEESGLELTGENEGIISAHSEINQEILQISDYVRHDKKLKTKYMDSMAYAGKALFDGFPDVALASLKRVRNDIERYLQRKVELIYLAGAAIATGVVPLIYLIMFYIGNLNELSHEVFFAAIFAVIGGFLSVASSANKIVVDIQNSFFTTLFHGMLRIVIAMLSGIFFYFAVISGMILSVLNREQYPYIIYITCAVAGFFERLVPNLMLEIGHGKTEHNPLIPRERSSATSTDG